MAYFNALLQHHGPLKHVGHAHRVATKPTPNVAPTGGFTLDQDGVRIDGGRFLTMGMEKERTPEEKKRILERVLEMTNMEIEYILITGRAYEALNAEYVRIADNSGRQMSDQLGNKYSYHVGEIMRLSARLPAARLKKTEVETKLSMMIHGLPSQ